MLQGFLTKQIRDKQSKINFFFDKGLYWRQVFSCGHQRLPPVTITILLLNTPLLTNFADLVCNISLHTAKKEHFIVHRSEI